MDIFEKTKDDWDCRAIPQEFLEKFYKGGKYYPFVKLVEGHPDLQLCFRGNDYNGNNPTSGGKVCIYRNNHAMFTITPNTLYFNPNYLRYCEDWEKKIDILINKYGFNKGRTIKLEKVKRTENRKTKVIAYSCGFKSNGISVSIDNEFLDNLEELYTLLTKVFDDFFSEDDDKCIDRFLEWGNQHDEVYAGEIPSEYYIFHKKVELEKIRQQQLFLCMQFQEDGYYFYDMEFQQKHKDGRERDEAKKKGESNKPDMQAIRFGADGKPQALVFVEVKSTKSAYEGEASGLYKHIEAMRRYPDDAKDRRRREAFLILHQYQKLGLRELDRELNWEEYAQLPFEIILIFTDEAIDLWKADKSAEIESIKCLNDNREDEDIELPNGQKALLVRA